MSDGKRGKATKKAKAKPAKKPELSEAELSDVAGGLRIRSIGGSTSSKPPTYIPAPPAPQVPVPYPAGM